MATTTTYIGYDDQPVPGPEVYFGLRKPGQSEIESFHPTEAAAIKAASDRSLASSPPGTTAVIGEDSIDVTINGKTFPVTIERDGDLIEMVNQSGRPLASILRITPRVVYTPGRLDPWQVRERPFAALREAALDYARHTLPVSMIAVIEAVDAGKLAWEAAPRALGIRGRMESCPDGEDDATFDDQTPKAIREDAWRGWHLLNAWLPAPNFYPLRAIRQVDAAYRRRMSFLIQACDRALRDLPPPTDLEITAGAFGAGRSTKAAALDAYRAMIVHWGAANLPAATARVVEEASRADLADLKVHDGFFRAIARSLGIRYENNGRDEHSESTHDGWGGGTAEERKAATIALSLVNCLSYPSYLPTHLMGEAPETLVICKAAMEADKLVVAG